LLIKILLKKSLVPAGGAAGLKKINAGKSNLPCPTESPFKKQRNALFATGLII